MPAHYVKIEVKEGVPLPDFGKIAFYGIRHAELEERLGEGATKLMFEGAFELIYSFNA